MNPSFSQCYDQKSFLEPENWIQTLIYIPVFQGGIKAMGLLFATDLLSVVQCETSNKSHLFAADTWTERPSHCNYTRVIQTELIRSFVCTTEVHSHLQYSIMPRPGYWGGVGCETCPTFRTDFLLYGCKYHIYLINIFILWM